VHDLPDSQLAEWQIKDEFIGMLLYDRKDLDHIWQKPVLIENTGARSDRELQTRTAIEPCWTLRAMGEDGHWHRANALLENAKVKALDIACLADLQSFPRWYKFSGKKSLDVKGIGNSVPPLMYQKILQAVHPQAIALPNKELVRLAA